MTDSKDKSGSSENIESSDENAAPEESASANKKQSSEPGNIPSTLEKAVAKVSNDRKAKSEKKTKAHNNNTASGNNQEPGAIAPRRKVGSGVVGAASVLLLLAVAYFAWPVLQPVLPGWMQTSTSPSPGVRPPSDIYERVARFADRIEPLEKDISSLKAEFAARPVADPARLLALDDLVKQNGERLAALKSEMESVGQGATGDVSEDQLAVLSKRLEEMEARLVALASRPSGESAPEANIAVEALDALRAQSSERMSALEKENVALRDIVAVLDKRVAAIEEKSATVSADTTRSNALVLAVGQLREAGRGTQPFAVALQAVEALADGQDSLAKPLAVLKTHATTGVPDLIDLRAHFDRIAGRIAHEAFVPKGEGWIDRTLGKVSRIFTFRRTGPDAASGDDENARVARAEIRLAAGDLASAVQILDGLQEPGLGYAAPWLTNARARLAVDAAIKALFSEALSKARVTGGDKGTPGG